MFLKNFLTRNDTDSKTMLHYVIGYEFTLCTRIYDTCFGRLDETGRKVLHRDARGCTSVSSTCLAGYSFFLTLFLHFY